MSKNVIVVDLAHIDLNKTDTYKFLDLYMPVQPQPYVKAMLDATRDHAARSAMNRAIATSFSYVNVDEPAAPTIRQQTTVRFHGDGLDSAFVTIIVSQIPGHATLGANQDHLVASSKEETLASFDAYVQQNFGKNFEAFNTDAEIEFVSVAAKIRVLLAAEDYDLYTAHCAENKDGTGWSASFLAVDANSELSIELLKP